MSHAAANRGSLARRQPRTLRILDDLPPALGKLDIIPTPGGDPTAVRDGLLIHSRHDPRREAAGQVAAGIDDSTTSALILGFGLGYGAEAVRQRFPGLPILVLEPDAGMFKAALDARDLTGILADERVSFLVGEPPEEISSMLAALPLAKPAFLRLRPALQRDPQWFRAAEEVVRSWLLRRDININTLSRFGRLWVRNLVRNMPAFAAVPGIARLEGLFSGVPALVLAGGPSLDLLLPHLGNLAERMVVIAVNTPLKRCREIGVEPDFTVVVDPQYWASRFMDWAPLRRAKGSRDESGSIIVAEPSTHPRVMRTSARIYFCSSLFPLGETLEAAVGSKGRLGAGGSVATAAWDLARHLGASPIYIAGLDLGFPGMRTHCKGIFTEDLWLSSSGRLTPLEGSSFRYLREIGVFPVRSCSGGTTMTDRRMLIYKWWFENQLTLRPEARTFTLSPDGVAIKGMALADMGSVLSLPEIRGEIEARKETERLSLAGGSSLGAKTALRESLEGLQIRLDELSTLAGKGLEVNAALDAAIRDGKAVAPLLGELDALDARILDISARSIAGFLMQPLIQQIDGKGEKKASPLEVLADSEALYRGIGDSARWQRDLISHALDLLAADPELFSPKGSQPPADLFK